MKKMTINGLSVTFNMPDAYKAAADDKASHYLPPYAPQDAYNVDEYPNALTSWIRGTASAASFFVPVKDGKGMWLDLNDNARHSHHVAALISIQGINPVTGLKTAGSGLEQYLKCCPKHNIEFQADRFCPSCGFKWPKQNYLSTTGTPWGSLWLDGFRADDGNIRQYVFTKDEARGVAAQLIGNDRVFAIAVSFYLSKNPKPQPKLGGILRACGAHHESSFDLGPVYAASAVDNYAHDGHVVKSRGPKFGYCASSDLKLRSSNMVEHRLADMADEEQERLEIAAGARIIQRIYDDPETLDFWKPSPENTIYICYCSQKDADRVLKGGKRPEKEEGFLTDIKVGN